MAGVADEGSKKIYTLAEVSAHNNRQDCWLLIAGKVYDVTKFLDDHPGGYEVMLFATEKDATDDFEDVGHSDSAREQMKEYYIGEIDAATVPARVDFAALNQRSGPEKPASEQLAIKALQFLIPLAIVGLAVGIRFYTKSL